MFRSAALSHLDTSLCGEPNLRLSPPSPRSTLRWLNIAPSFSLHLCQDCGDTDMALPWQFVMVSLAPQPAQLLLLQWLVSCPPGLQETHLSLPVNLIPATWLLEGSSFSGIFLSQCRTSRVPLLFPHSRSSTVSPKQLIGVWSVCLGAQNSQGPAYLGLLGSVWSWDPNSIQLLH